MEKQISVSARDEILKEIACILAIDLNSGSPHQHSLNAVLFTELSLNFDRMQHGVYEKWWHGERAVAK